ncbi:hypothetical protein F4777DRAFT_457148 [Nemania sp. FL0916]|nr:hypothetical protein F4777DRAFT_457148 [Nemania sp. FL0916]
MDAEAGSEFYAGDRDMRINMLALFQHNKCPLVDPHSGCSSNIEPVVVNYGNFKKLQESVKELAIARTQYWHGGHHSMLPENQPYQAELKIIWDYNPMAMPRALGNCRTPRRLGVTRDIWLTFNMVRIRQRRDILLVQYDFPVTPSSNVAVDPAGVYTGIGDSFPSGQQLTFGRVGSGVGMLYPAILRASAASQMANVPYHDTALLEECTTIGAEACAKAEAVDRNIRLHDKTKHATSVPEETRDENTTTHANDSSDSGSPDSQQHDAFSSTPIHASSHTTQPSPENVAILEKMKEFEEQMSRVAISLCTIFEAKPSSKLIAHSVADDEVGAQQGEADPSPNSSLHHSSSPSIHQSESSRSDTSCCKSCGAKLTSPSLATENDVHAAAHQSGSPVALRCAKVVYGRADSVSSMAEDKLNGLAGNEAPETHFRGRKGSRSHVAGVPLSREHGENW